jgi:AraC family transcriptional regulator, transcriptional activator of pobA
MLRFALREPDAPRLELRRLNHEYRFDATGKSLGLHGHQFFELLLIEQARGIHRFAGREIKVARGDLFLIAPGETHDQSDLKVTRGWLLVFEPSAWKFEASASVLPQNLMLLSFLRPQGFDAGHFRLEAEALRDWTQHLQLLGEELRTRQTGFAAASRILLEWLLIKAARLAETKLEQINVSSQPVLREVFAVIESRFREGMSLDDVALAVHRSKAHLTSVVKRETGRNVLEWIIERRLSEARRLLLETNLSIEGIAEQLGYAEPTYFVRQFRALNAITPAVWRRANRGS